MLISSSELLPGDKILSVPVWKKWKADSPPNMKGAVVTEVILEFVQHLPKVTFKGNFTQDYFIAAVMVEVERTGSSSKG